MIRKPIFIIVVLMLAFLMTGCPALNSGQMNAEQRYLSALSTYNDNVEQYLAMYDVASPAKQAEWKEKIDPIVVAAGMALDVWGESVSDSGAETNYKAALRKLLAALVSYGIVKVED